MWEKLENLTFEEWVYHIFDHPDTWYYAIGTEFWDGPAETTIDYMTRLFEDPVPPLEGFSDEELNRGFWYLVSNGGSDMMFTLADSKQSFPNRRRCVEAISVVHEKLFMPRCTPYLSHLDEKGVAPLNSICYMWWDLMPVGNDAIIDVIRDVMERQLAMDHVALQEGALHGLGHWARQDDRVSGIIEAYLGRNQNLRAELRVYAQSALGGCVL
jgi:hypothetical protein